MANNNFSKNFFLGAFLVLIALTAVLIKPLLVALITGAVLAYVFHPIYKKLEVKLKSKTVAASIIIILLIFLLAIPTYFIANAMTKEGYTLFLNVKKTLQPGAISITDCAKNPKLFCEFSNKIVNSLQDPQVKFYLEDASSKFSNYVISETSKFIINLPTMIMGIFVMLFTIYYLLKDGVNFIHKVKYSIPLKRHHVDHIIKEFDNFTYATIYGNFFTAIAQGLVGGLVFYILKIQTPILAGLAMGLFSVIPYLGPFIIWLPVSIGLLLSGEVGKAIILFLAGTFIISIIDNIVKPEIIGKKTKLHPAAVLVGIIGGIASFGPIGILAGPLIISLLLSFIEVYYKEGLGFSH